MSGSATFEAKVTNLLKAWTLLGITGSGDTDAASIKAKAAQRKAENKADTAGRSPEEIYKAGSKIDGAATTARSANNEGNIDVLNEALKRFGDKAVADLQAKLAQAETDLETARREGGEAAATRDALIDELAQVKGELTLVTKRAEAAETKVSEELAARQTVETKADEAAAKALEEVDKLTKASAAEQQRANEAEGKLLVAETAATAAQGELQQARSEIQQNVRDLQAAQAAIGREEAARLAAEAAKTTAETDVRNLQGQLTQAGVRINADGQTIRDQVQKIARLTSDLTNAEAYIARYDQRDAQHAQSVNHWQGRARLVESWKVAAPMLCKAAVLVTGVVIGAGLGIKAATAAAAVGTTAVVMMLGGAAGGFIVGKSIINHFTNTQPATHYVGRTRKIAGGVLQFALCVGLLGYAINKGYFNSLTANSPGLQGVASVTQSLDRLAGKVAIGSSGVIDSLSGSAPAQGAVTGAANLTQGRGVAAPAQGNAAVTTVAPGALYTVSPQTPMYNNEAKAGTIYTFSNHDPFLAQGAMRNGLAYGYAVKPDHTQVPGWVDMRKLTIRNQQNSMNIRGYNKVTLSAKAHSFG